MTTMKKLRAAIKRVEREIQRLGLWIPEMESVQVYLTPVHIWYGWTNMHTGNIFIPRVSVSRWTERRPWTLLNVLRHEYGHALTFNHPELLEDGPTTETPNRNTPRKTPTRILPRPANTSSSTKASCPGPGRTMLAS
jgi:hypothetical protein